jgi:hypothetical protein
MHAIIRLLFHCKCCGKCCKIPRAYSQSDVDRIEAYTHEPREHIESKLEEGTCGYLKNDICTVHFAKPSVCVWWPGPGAECPGYQELVEKYAQPGAMSAICNRPDLQELYIKVVTKNDIEAAKEILRRLNIE